MIELDSVKNLSAIVEPLGPAPDLPTTSLEEPSMAAAGSEVPITAQVQNQGSVDAGPFRLGSYLSEDSDIFNLDIYDGDTGLPVRTITTQPLPAQRWRQVNAILADHAPGTAQGYVRIRQTSGNNPFLAYGVVNDGGAPGQRSGDGAYVPARGRRLPAYVSRLSVGGGQ